MDEKIVIPLSKTKIVMFIILGLIFIGLGIFLTWLGFSQEEGMNGIILKSGGIFCSILFLALEIPLIRKLSDSQPGVIISEKGIWDNSASVFGERTMLWKNITGFAVAEIQGTKLLIINIKNPEEVILGFKSFKQKMLQYNYENYGSPICISSNALKCDFENLLKLFQKSFERYAK